MSLSLFAVLLLVTAVIVKSGVNKCALTILLLSKSLGLEGQPSWLPTSPSLYEITGPLLQKPYKPEAMKKRRPLPVVAKSFRHDLTFGGYHVVFGMFNLIKQSFVNNSQLQKARGYPRENINSFHQTQNANMTYDSLGSFSH